MKLKEVEYNDICESFEVMDEERIGAISMNAFETLCLGLGYDNVDKAWLGQQLVHVRKQRRRSSSRSRTEARGIHHQQQQQQQQQHDSHAGGGGITLTDVLEILSKLPRRDRRDELETCFQLLLAPDGDESVDDDDSSHLNMITPRQLMKLSIEMGEPLSLEEANAMMPNGPWDRTDLERLLSPAANNKKRRHSG